MQNIESIEAIKQLKYKYFRLLDCKRHDELCALMTDDITTGYDNGRHSYNGKAALLSFFQESMSDPAMYHSHQGHHPEITIIDDENATGVWAFEDTVIFRDQNMIIEGAGVYHDEYRFEDGAWKISHTGYERLWCRSETLHEVSWREIRGFHDAEERKLSQERGYRDGEAHLFKRAITAES